MAIYQDQYQYLYQYNSPFNSVCGRKWNYIWINIIVRLILSVAENINVIVCLILADTECKDADQVIVFSIVNVIVIVFVNVFVIVTLITLEGCQSGWGWYLQVSTETPSGTATKYFQLIQWNFINFCNKILSTASMTWHQCLQQDIINWIRQKCCGKISGPKIWG